MTLTIGLLACRERPITPPKINPPPIVVRAEMPVDVPGGAAHADLATASRFAWQQFIAMNWPAKPQAREVPDPLRRFGEPGIPVVWETMRSKVEVYPGNGSGSIKPHGAEEGAPDYGYDAPPLYVYSPDEVPRGLVPPCRGQAAVENPAWVNLDEVSQVGFDHLYAGVLGTNSREETARLVRFTAKANRVHYRYVVASGYWYSGNGSPYQKASGNFVNAVTNQSFPPKAPFVSFPGGTIEAKAAFRPLTPAEASSGRFYTTRVRFYESGDGGEGCYREGTWGLLALHIIQKTPTAPAFTWATFEQADNLLATVGGNVVPVEDENGVVIHNIGSTTPPLSYQDGPYRQGQLPIVRKNGPFCSDPGARLYYREIAVDAKGDPYANTPSGGNLCVDGRMRRIPQAIVGVNREAHQAIAGYEAVNRLRPSPWRYYKLINIQTFPFDKSEIVADENSPRGAATYYLSNMVVETDYTLQNHSGGPETRTGAAPSDLTVNFAKYPQPPDSPDYRNAYLLKTDGSFVARYNMGGCTGCHGLTQVIAGSDYSYLLSGSTVKEPEFPETSPRTLSARYLGRFLR